MTEYECFLREKEVRAEDAGFEAKELNDHLFDYERDVVMWALRKGKAALFEDCGLGKTIQQLAWAEKVREHTGKSVLIVAPLSVAHQTVKEAEKFGIRARYAADGEVCREVGIYTTNYERIEKFDAGAFSGVVLDESSILKDYTSSTKQMLVEKFQKTPFRLCSLALLHGHAQPQRLDGAWKSCGIFRDHDPGGDAGHILCSRRRGHVQMAAEGTCHRGVFPVGGELGLLHDEAFGSGI